MASRKLEDHIERIQHLRDGAPSADAAAFLKKSLQDRANLIVAEAARTTAELRIVEQIPDLLTAYSRLFIDPIKTDPKCWGKTAIVKALTVLDYCESPPYLLGSRHVQMEPVWGGQEDAAGPLRSNCILALPQCTDLLRPEVFRHLVDALADALDPVRVEAVRAIEQMNGDEAPLILRLKARLGDTRPAVIGCAFDALLNLERDKGLAFVAEFLNHADPEIRDEAALSMGASRQSQAIPILIACWNHTTDRNFRSVLLRAISSSREESAFEFLLNLVKDGSHDHATLAMEALSLHRDSPEIQTRIDQAKKQRIEE